MTLTSKPPQRRSSPQSTYGGRPAFGARRTHREQTAQAVLYELLPRAQAEERRRRCERNGRRVVLRERNEVLGEELFETGHWTWDDWVALKVGRLEGPRFQAILSVVRQTLEGVDVDPAPLATTQGGELLLPEDAGIRLALAFVGVKPLQRYDRMRAMARGLDRMSMEECYYWHALCRSPSTPNGAKALRILLTSHID